MSLQSFRHSFSVSAAALAPGHPYPPAAVSGHCTVDFVEFRGTGPPSTQFGRTGDVYVDLNPRLHALYWKDGDTERGAGQWRRWTSLVLDRVPLYRFLVAHPWTRDPEASDLYLWVDPITVGSGIIWTSRDALCANRVKMIQQGIATIPPGTVPNVEELVSQVIHCMLEREREAPPALTPRPSGSSNQAPVSSIPFQFIPVSFPEPKSAQPSAPLRFRSPRTEVQPHNPLLHVRSSRSPPQQSSPASLSHSSPTSHPAYRSPYGSHSPPALSATASTRPHSRGFESRNVQPREAGFDPNLSSYSHFGSSFASGSSTSVAGTSTHIWRAQMHSGDIQHDPISDSSDAGVNLHPDMDLDIGYGSEIQSKQELKRVKKDIAALRRKEKETITLSYHHQKRERELEDALSATKQRFSATLAQMQDEELALQRRAAAAAQETQMTVAQTQRAREGKFSTWIPDRTSSDPDHYFFCLELTARQKDIQQLKERIAFLDPSYQG